MKNLVVLTGAGMSAESGIKTFRDADGLWEGHDIMEVASPEGWAKNKALVLDFYNHRRRQLKTVKPNKGHLGLVALENYFNVHIITQNVDNLHERAGSSNILHLHGELNKVRSTIDENLIYDWQNDLNLGDTCKLGSQLRPHIVWFGEAVPKIEPAIDLVKQADIFVVIGTSLLVYPAAGLINYVRYEVPKFIVDPKIPELGRIPNLTRIEKGAEQGVELLQELLIKLNNNETN